ncbi:MAG: hypothetical protein A3J63_02080 [Candidatus Moranbacteria bacterium RIFCSPHIGHO2_02_FULL_40_12b]|nr:MAG: hypothetical protein A3J63_02080 [Candidatus Moranbacteria bacterium RIFCSPHIGHO2_02_FULL_40_12b]OGI23479.1 MAG: hypothetical protein A3E91_01685 [Candidatus Moranbacteria bacterium RIFCSPHIGHO2_12_FULL_40_10]
MLNKIKKLLKKTGIILKIHEAKDISEISSLVSSHDNIDAIILGKTVGDFSTSFVYFSSDKKAKEFASALNLKFHRALTPGLYYVNIYEAPAEFLKNIQDSGNFDVSIT